MPTIMENWETHKPGAEEERLGTAHETTNAREASTRPEVAGNPRIRALMAARDKAERKLQEAMLDIETREQSPAFQKAKALSEEGWHLIKTGGYDSDDLHYYLLPPDVAWGQDNSKYRYDYYTDGGGDADFISVNESRDVLQDLGLGNGAADRQVLHFLVDLTREDEGFRI